MKRLGITIEIVFYLLKKRTILLGSTGAGNLAK
jgi:hypothetical protein